MKCVLKYILFLLLIFLFGCTWDEEDNGYMDSVGLQFNLKAIHSDVKVRVIIADATTGKVLSNNYPVDLSLPYEKKIRPGNIHVYVLGNEPARISPPLSIMDHEDGLFPLIIDYDEIPRKENPEGGLDGNPSENSNLPLFVRVDAEVRMKDGEPGRGEVRIDGESTWSEALDIQLERLAVRLSLQVRKKDDFVNDVIITDNVRVINIPKYAYLLPRTYMETSYYLPQSPPDAVLGTELQVGTYTTIFDGFIIPEYYPSNPQDRSMAVNINLHVLFNSVPVMFSMVIPTTDESSTTYSLERNTYHEVSATIVSAGGVVSNPEIEYQVSSWTDANNPVEINRVIQFSADWAPGTAIQDQNVYVPTNGVTEFKFTLSRPEGAKWMATITNPIDFIFDYTDGAVSAGLGGGSIERTIRIRPRKPTTSSNTKTEFYITVNYGSDNIELNLPDHQVGNGNRYTIIQIPD